MYLVKPFADELFKLGFQRAEYHENFYPYDIYGYNEEEWTLGGKILPTGDILSKKEIYIEGIWLPTSIDLMIWLDDNNCSFNINYDNKSFRTKVLDANGKEYNGKGATLEVSLFYAIKKILKVYGGNPVNKKYIVEHAIYLGKEE